jgi:hypothetical protein
MVSIIPHRLQAARLGAAACLAALLLSGLGAAHQTQAMVACRADPVITLSNGAVIDLNLSIVDTLSDVSHVAYTLHGPIGTSVVSYSYPDGTGAISSVTYVADDTPGNYDGDTTVTTRTKVAMTAYLAVLALPTSGGTPTPAAPAQGHSAQDLHIHLHIA